MVTWISALARTRHAIAGSLRRLFASPRAEAATLDQIEETLIGADVAPDLVAELRRTLERSYAGLHVSRREVVARLLAELLPESPFSWEAPARPGVVLVVGVNGSGKTTTCAKLARLAAAAGRRPLLGAADTFRAAGAEQLRLWADRLGCEVVAGAPGADAAAVAYDAAEAAAARGADWLLLDTAGRMHTRQPLMQELGKIRRALDKRLPGAPHECWIVLDASVGRNALVQARQFHEAVPLTGAVVAKLDGSAKAGFVFSIARELGTPVRFAGLGEQAEDLVPFDRAAFVRALLGDDDAAPAA